jgi:hypothetical protein
MRAALLVLAALALFPRVPVIAADDGDALRPVRVVPDGRLQLTTPAGTGAIPIYVSRDWSAPQPGVTRAIVMIHGLSRRGLGDAGDAAQRAGAAARDAILVVPQFLIQNDIDAHQLPFNVLRFGPDDWKAGYAALGPAPISSYDVIDAIFLRLADRRLFPNLQTVVLAGHSAGGQFVQRYAAVGQGQGPLLALGIHLRYVVSNPSSYVYFSADRPPAADGSSAIAAQSCPRLNEWPYGFDERLPGYVTQPIDVNALERDYAARDIVYLLGTADTDPDHPELDRSCAGEAEGPTRFARGLAFVWSLLGRHPTMQQRLLEAPGIGHDGDQMFSSACGLTALFDTPGCPDTPLYAAHPAAAPHA